MHYTNIISKEAKCEFIKFIEARQYNYFVTAHFPFELLQTNKNEYCVSRANAFYVRLERRVFRDGYKGLRLKHFTTFEEKNRFGHGSPFHLHALWYVPDEWKDRIEERAPIEWGKTFGMKIRWVTKDDTERFIDNRLQCNIPKASTFEIAPIKDISCAVPYILKHIDSGHDFLMSE